MDEDPICLIQLSGYSVRAFPSRAALVIPMIGEVLDVNIVTAPEAAN